LSKKLIIFVVEFEIMLKKKLDIGGYVLLEVKKSKGFDSSEINFINNNIGKIINLKPYIIIKYEKYLDNGILDKTINLQIKLSDIKFYGKTYDDIQLKIKATK
jgi:hypothetical protein